MAPIETEIDSLEKLQEILQNNPGVVIIKFSAQWCKPCKLSASSYSAAVKNLPSTYRVFFIDIDESLDVYMFYKNKRMISGIPAAVAYKKGNISPVPDNVISSSDPKQIDAFFQQCAALL